MCGIAGIFSYHKAAHKVDKIELRAICSHMRARGPDGRGEWYSKDGSIALAHRRLSIIDMSDNAAQPMSTKDGSLIISFNGEIYNYKELRLELKKKGYIFHTQSDTEVLLHLYTEKGERMVDDLRGMFAFALWDAKINALLLARDPYGIKPLYYSDNGQTVRVASQVKAILSGGQVSSILDPAGIVGFYLLGSIPEPHTLYKEIKSVPAGSVIWINDNKGISNPKQYFSIAKIFSEAEQKQILIKDGEAEEIIHEALVESIKYHFIADVPVGVFLSSGIDSSVIVAMAKENGYDNLETVTLGFSEYLGRSDDEAPLAAKVADYYNSLHSTYSLDSDEFSNDLPNIIESMDQPSIDGINTYFVSKAASKLGWKVALSGIGGDELFGGYSSFKDIIKWVNIMSIPSAIPFFGDLFQRALSVIDGQSSTINPKFSGMLKYGGSYPGAYLLKRGLFLPEELPLIMNKEIAQEGLESLEISSLIKGNLNSDIRSGFSKVSTMESSMYMRNQLLRDADWAGMAHSLEIRTPLVDAHLLRKISPVLVSKYNKKGKQSLAMAPIRPLPDNIRNRPKTGFTVPVSQWLQKDKQLDVWRNVHSLNKSNCPWARRWAYTIMNLNVLS